MEALCDIPNVSALLSGTGSTRLTPLQAHLLRGWKPNTLSSYNSGVKKFLNFYDDSRKIPFHLPASQGDIYDFCLSVGRSEASSTGSSISSKTLSRYLSALQAWHLFHQVPYPHDTKEVVKVILRASERADALEPAKQEKPAVLLEHLLALFHALRNGSDKDKAILDCALCAFWGLARLAEVTYNHKDGQPAWINSVLMEDVLRPSNSLSHVIVKIRGAKTARPGVAQDLLLNAQPNYLCPVKAILRRMATARTSKDSLFGYQDGNNNRLNLTRSTVVNRCQQVWKGHGWTSLSGHSFRVGGASLRAALGIPHEDIQKLGRWTSSCYLIYLRNYSDDDLRKSISLLQVINSTPERKRLDSASGL